VRVVYYTQSAYFASALLLARELSRLVELHLLLEVTPDAWQIGQFDLQRQNLPSALVPADPVLGDSSAARLRRYWQDTASFNLVVHNQRRSLHPASWRVSRQVVQHLDRLAPDVVHIDDESLRLALALPRRSRRPMVLSVHDPEPHSGEHDWRSDLARRLMFGRVARFVLHNRTMAGAFARQYGLRSDRVEVLPLGVYDTDREWPAAERLAEQPTVLFFGRLSPYKGLEVLYRAIPHVLERCPTARFVVAGRPIAGYRPPRPPESARSRVEEIFEHISNARAADLFRRATVVVCPYTDATQSGVVLTAYAFAKPVVGTRVGGMPEYVHHNETGLIVPERHPEALADALVSILSNESLRRRLAEGVSCLSAGDLSWPTIARQTVAVYRDVLSNHRGRTQPAD
jgi:glycosyltransferase involved in cell wall biosynthesis